MIGPRRVKNENENENEKEKEKEKESEHAGHPVCPNLVASFDFPPTT
jgi:hypothetical protein